MLPFTALESDELIQVRGQSWVATDKDESDTHAGHGQTLFGLPSLSDGGCSTRLKVTAEDERGRVMLIAQALSTCDCRRPRFAASCYKAPLQRRLISLSRVSRYATG